MPVGTYTPSPLANHYTKIYKKCFFISISILGRSGVKEIMNNLVISFNKSGVDPCVLSNFRCKLVKSNTNSSLKIIITLKVFNILPSSHGISISGMLFT